MKNPIPHENPNSQKKNQPQALTGADVLALRKEQGLNQLDFWSPLGVTQSGGSRYEAGRKIPRPVQKLLQLYYITGLDENQAEAIKGQ